MSDEQTQNDQSTPEQQVEAREMGWRPKEEFQGAPEKWVDAATFIERGQHVMPILKENNRRLREDLSRATSEAGQLKATVADLQQTMETLEKYHQDDVKQKVEAAKKRVMADLVQAKRDGNVEQEVALTDELTQLNATTTVVAENPPKKTENNGGNNSGGNGKDLSQDPVFQGWVSENSWLQDPTKMAIAHSISLRLRQGGNTQTGRAFLDTLAVETSKEIAKLGGRPVSKVNSGGHGAGNGGGGGGGNGVAKSYADLPQDAKDACDQYARDLVGPNKKYKTADDWRKSYVTQYFKEI